MGIFPPCVMCFIYLKAGPASEYLLYSYCPITTAESFTIPTTISAEGHGAGFYTTLRNAGFKDEDLAKLIKSEKDIIRLVNKIKSMQNQNLKIRSIRDPKVMGSFIIQFLLKMSGTYL